MTDEGSARSGSARPVHASRSGSDRSIAIWLAIFIFTFFAGLTHGHFESSDEWTVFEATASLWHAGVPAVNPAPYTHRGPDGHLYSQYMLGQSVLALPYFALGRLARVVLPDAWLPLVAGAPALTDGRSIAGGHPEITTVTFFAPTMIGLIVALCFLLQRELGVSLRSATLVSVLIGTTSHVAVHAVYFLRHGTTTVLLLGTLLALQRHRVRRDPWSLSIAALFAIAIPLVRLPDAILAVPLAGFFLWVLREDFLREGHPALGRALPSIGVPVLIGLGFFIASNQIRWGTWIATPILSFSPAFDLRMLDGLAGFLFSPGASLFVYSPLLLIVPWALAGFVRRDRALALVCLGTSLGLLLFYSKWRYWAGLPVAPGPRYLFAITPLLLISLGPWLDESVGKRRPAMLAGLALVGASIQTPLLITPWNVVRRTIGEDAMAASAAPWPWLFDLEKSPALVAFQVASKGQFDNFIWQYSQGWDGFAPRADLTIGFGIVWLLAIGATAFGLFRSIRMAETLRPH